jgi:hypothetical protein
MFNDIIEIKENDIVEQIIQLKNDKSWTLISDLDDSLWIDKENLFHINNITERNYYNVDFINRNTTDLKIGRKYLLKNYEKLVDNFKSVYIITRGAVLVEERQNAIQTILDKVENTHYYAFGNDYIGKDITKSKLEIFLNVFIKPDKINNILFLDDSYEEHYKNLKYIKEKNLNINYLSVLISWSGKIKN